MRTTKPIIALVIVLALVGFGSLILARFGHREANPTRPQDAPAVSGPDVVQHAQTTAEFDAVAREAKGLVLVDFYADWCPPCRQLAPVLAEIAKEQAGRLTVVKVNVDNARELAQSYKVQGIPHLVLLRDGNPVDTRTGFVPKTELLKWLQPHMPGAAN